MNQVNSGQILLGLLLMASALGVILYKKPIYASLSFLMTLTILAAFYLQLSAEFIAVMQILVYAGAILVIFVFVILLFQDAYQQLLEIKPKSNQSFLFFTALALALTLALFFTRMLPFSSPAHSLPEGYGNAGSIGQALYIDFFFPFEAVILLFLVAVVGSLYIAKREG